MPIILHCLGLGLVGDGLRSGRVDRAVARLLAGTCGHRGGRAGGGGGAVRAGRRLGQGELAHCAVRAGGTRGGKLARIADGAVARDLSRSRDGGLAD